MRFLDLVVAELERETNNQQPESEKMFPSEFYFPPEDPRAQIHSRSAWIPHSVNDIMQRFLNMLHPACVRSQTVIDYFHRAWEKTRAHQGLLLIEILCVISATSSGWWRFDAVNWCNMWKQMNSRDICDPILYWVISIFYCSILKASECYIVCWHLVIYHLAWSQVLLTRQLAWKLFFIHLEWGQQEFKSYI